MVVHLHCRWLRIYLPPHLENGCAWSPYHCPAVQHDKQRGNTKSPLVRYLSLGSPLVLLVSKSPISCSLHSTLAVGLQPRRDNF